MRPLFCIITLILLLTIFFSCNISKKIEGLWLIDKVKIGQEEMTPIARWTRFNENQTQASGNGWLQHSIGNWSYEKNTKTLMINTTNGMRDEFGGFVVRFDQGKMIWTREENGQSVEVSLKRISELPQAPANTLLGVWKLIHVEEPEK